MAIDLGSIFFTINSKHVQLDSAMKALSKTHKNSNQLSDGLKRLDNKFKKTDASAGKAASSVNGLAGAFRLAGAALVGVATGKLVNTFIAVSDRAQLLDNRLRAVTGSVEDFNNAQQQLLAISNATGTVIANNAQLFQRLSISAKSLGATQDQMLQLTETVANLGRISGSTAEDVKNSTRQLAQGLGSTYFRAEEFNSIIEQMPALIESVADEMGITASEVNMLVKQGKLMSKDVFEALEKSAEKARKRAEKLPLTFAESMNVVGNSVLMATRGLNNMYGITGNLSIAVRTFGQLIAGAFGQSQKTMEITEDRVKAVQGAMVNLLAITDTVMSYYIDFSHMMNKLWRDAGATAKDFLSIMFINFKKTFENVKKIILDSLDLEYVFGRIYRGIIKSAKALAEFAGEDSSIGKRLNEFVYLNTQIGEASEEYKKLDLRANNLGQSLNDVNKNLDDFISAGGSLDSVIGQSLLQEGADISRAYEAAKSARDEFYNNNKDLIKLDVESELNTKGLVDDLEISLTNMAEGVDSVVDRTISEAQSRYEARLKKYQEFLKKGSTPLKDINTGTTAEDTGYEWGKEFIDSVNSAIDEFGSSNSQRIVDRLFGDGDVSFKDLAENYVKRLMTALLDEMVMNPLVNVAQKQFQALFKTGVDAPQESSGGIFSLLGLAGNFFGGGTSAATKSAAAGASAAGYSPELIKAWGLDGARANGGPVKSGGSYLVGENGPELFTPRNAGMIHNQQQMAGLGSVSNSVNVVINTTETAKALNLARGRINSAANNLQRTT